VKRVLPKLQTPESHHLPIRPRLARVIFYFAAVVQAGSCTATVSQFRTPGGSDCASRHALPADPPITRQAVGSPGSNIARAA